MSVTILGAESMILLTFSLFVRQIPCDIQSNYAVLGASSHSWPQRAMKSILPCGFRSVRLHDDDTADVAVDTLKVEV
jgi:hypothetical protein